MRAWPPTVDDVKEDAGITVSTDDDRLEMVLDAAIAYVRRVRPRVNYDADATLVGCLPDPTDDMWLGTVRLAARWHDRRRSVDGLVDMGDQGATRIPTVDPDIEKLLRIGRYAKAKIG